MNNSYAFSSWAPVWIKSDTGLARSSGNYGVASDRTYCEFGFVQEQYKCLKYESQVCLAAGCNVTYNVYNAVTNQPVAPLVNGGTIARPPCQVNIQADVKCGFPIPGTVTVDLRSGTRSVATRGERVAPYFLFGDNEMGDVFAGTIKAGSYSIGASVTIPGILIPSVNFTFGTCVP